MIELKQGEGYVFEQVVTDSSVEGGLADLTGASAWLSFRKVGTADIKHKVCEIDIPNSKVSGRLTGDNTQEAGNHKVEIKIWLNELPMVLMQDEVRVGTSEMPDIPTVETL
jgi:hypothetical protein